jgi:hypothetical protein
MYISDIKYHILSQKLIVKQSTCLTIHFDDIVIHRTVGTIPKSIIKIVERGKVDTLNTKIHDRSHSYQRN